MKRWLALAGWLAVIAVSIAWLHRLGQAFPPALILDPGGPLEPALASALRLIGLTVGYWLAGSTLLYLMASVARLPAAVRAVRWATIGPVRRLVDRIVAGALVATMSLPTAVGAMTVSGYVPIPAGDAVEIDPTRSDDAGLFDQVEDQFPTAPPEDPATLFVPVQPTDNRQADNPPPADPHAINPQITITIEAIEVVVRPGDHMWQLAEQRLVQVRGRAVTDSEIAPYWLKVVGTNLSKIRSGDPDLIFPGEVLVLPAIDP